MRRFIILFFSLLSFSLSIAQTGPGGVGSSANIETWLDASKLSLIDNDPVSSWTDLSGNSNNADQGTSLFRPIFKENQINGLPAIDFDGVNSAMLFTKNITSTDITSFFVFSNSVNNLKVLMHSDSNIYILKPNQAGMGSNGPWKENFISHANNTFKVFSGTSSSSSGLQTLTSGSLSTQLTFNNQVSRDTSSLGATFRTGTSSYINHSDVSIAELVVYQGVLNSAKRKIVSNHLAAKYNLTAEQNLYTHKSIHGTDVIGIGQEADGSHTIAQGDGVIEISNASPLNNGDYLLVGHDAGGLATSVSVGVDATQRWTQVWRADLTGTPGTVDLTFSLGANDFATNGSDYVVYIENGDGDFTNGGTSIQETGRNYDGTAGTVTFTGITLSDGDFFTLAEKSGISPPTEPFVDFGPGGVGNTDNIEAWLDASKLSLIDNDPVGSWTDLSGNSNDADQGTSLFRPIFKENQINGLPAIDFDGVNSAMLFTKNITFTDITSFFVFSNSVNNLKVLMHSDSNIYILKPNQAGMGSNGPWKENFISHANNTFKVFSGTSSSSSGLQTLTSGSLSTQLTFNNQVSRGASSLGATFRTGTSSYLNHSDVSIAELVVYQGALNSAKRKIVSNHLAAKYNLTAEQNLYSHKSTHGHNVVGIGQEADGSHLESRDRDSILINNPSALGNGDYILIGNDDADFSAIATSAGGVKERWNKTWRVDKTGAPSAIDIQFFLKDNGFALPADYVVIIEEDDGDFSNGGTRIIESGSFNSADSSISFSGIDFVDGAIFTLAEKQGAIESVADADWSLPTTWNCGCVPASSDTVTILNDVTISSNQEIFNLFISNGSITFSGTDDTLGVYGELSIGSLGSVTAGDGTIAALGASAAGQTFNNTSGSVAALNNLFVNSTNGASIQSGAWSISNSLQVSSGGLDVTNATSITLISNSTSTAQVLESMSGAFTGEFIVQRHISGRNSNYSNMASPISDATAADLDDDLVLSNIGGNDGNALNTVGGIFSSMWFFDSPSDSYDTILSLTTALPSGRGYEVFLDTVGYFTGRVVDYRGSLSSGTKTFAADGGWNLIGNPYQSFIDWTLVSKGSIANSYYIYNSSTGNFNFFSGTIPDIAPGQGFWAELSSGTQLISFEENDKVDNNSSAFLRSKNSPSFSLALSSNQTDFSHKMEVLFDVNATSELDELDASYLKSPVTAAPAIYSKAINSDKDLIVNSLNPFEESQLIPIEIYAGLDGTYSIDAENVTELYKDYSCVYLKDKASNEAVDLSVEQSYQFETTKGTSNRFELIVSNSFIECEKLIADGSHEQKLDHQLSLRNAYGDWYVDYTLDDSQQQVEIRILNMAGQAVKKPVSFGASNAGTYRLQNLQDLNGIYLIQVKTKDGFLNKTVQL